MPRSVREQTDHSLVGSLRRAQGRAAVAAAQLVPGEDAWLTLARNEPNANIVAAPYDPLHAQTAIAGSSFPAMFGAFAGVNLARSAVAAKVIAAVDGSIAYLDSGFNGGVIYRLEPARSSIVLVDQSASSAAPIKSNGRFTMSGLTLGRGYYLVGFIVQGLGITAGNFYGRSVPGVDPDAMMRSGGTGGSVGARFPLYVPGPPAFSSPPAEISTDFLESAGVLGVGAPWIGLYSA